MAESLAPAAVGEVRACYRLALAAGADPEVKELVMNRPPMMSIGQLGTRFPAVLAELEAHVAEYGWIRAAGGQAEPMTVKELVQRLQMILLRWSPEHIERAAREPGVAAPAAAGGPATTPPVVTGQSVSVGRAVGRVRIMYGPMEVPALELGDVLVTAASTPDKMGTESAFPSREGAPAGMERVAAIVADEGGMLSHAATISRELGIPCVVGTVSGTQTLRDGSMVEVDATREVGRVITLDA